ncbi:MAG: sensor histidine kinase [Myxococcaceae bacterium]
MLLRSLRSRLLAAFLLPTLGLFGLAGYAGYALSRDILEDELGRSLSSVAGAAASGVSAERLLGIAPGDDEAGTRTWRNISAQLEALRSASGAQRVFAFDLSGRMRVDAGGSLPVGAEVPELARDRLELSRVFGGAPASSQVLFEGKDGRLYKTGYAPILQDGKVVGAVGVEGSAGFFGPLKRLFRLYALWVGSALLLLGLAAVLTARNIAAPLNRLVASALRIGRGDLETKVPAEPTLEIGILARELEEMRRGLESRDRQLKMMLAGVAHEVRNPIGGIELFAGLLAEELPAKGEAREHVERIRKEINYLKRIVEDFLAFAREQKLSRTGLEASDLFEAARELMKADADGKQVALELTADRGRLDGDESLLTSALVNLVKNAVQASPPGQKVALTGKAAGLRYSFEVRDAGGGIAAEALAQIFEPFFTTREKGTGLGLPLARKIAQAHQGDITVESAPGDTVFRLHLPLAGPPR